jgi:zinc protease
MEKVSVVGKFTHEVLGNGLNVFIQSVKTAPVVSMHFAVSTGSMHENPAGHGLSHFLEHMIFKGSEKYPLKSDISDEVQAAGAQINAYTTKDHTNYHIDSLSEYWPKMLEVLTDAVIHPLFPDAEFVPEKEVILREQSMYEDNPSYKLQQTTFRQLAGNHPFGLPVIGFKEKIKEVDRELMLDYYQRRYQPRNSTLILVGDFEANEVLKKVKALVGDWKNDTIETTLLPSYSSKQSFSEVDLFFEDNQARINIGFNLPTGSTEEVPIWDVIETMLSGSSSGLMIQELKQREEVAISVSSFNYMVENAGIFVCGGAALPEKLLSLEKGIFSIIEKLQKGDFSKQDVDRAILKNRISFINQLETVSSRAQNFINSVIDFGSPNYWDHYLERLKEVSKEDIKRLAKKYLNRHQAAVVRQWPQELQEQLQTKQKKIDDSLGQIQHKMTILKRSAVRFIELNQPSEQLATIQILFPYGSFIDPIGKKGASLLLSRLLMAGSKKWSEQEFAAKLNDHGISFKVSTGYNSFSLSFTFLPEEMQVVLAIIRDVLLTPNFDSTIFNREKKNCIELLKSRERMVFVPAISAFGEALFGKDHPYSQAVEGNSTSMQQVELADLEALLPCYFDRSKMVLSLTGHFDSTAICQEELDDIIDALPFSKLSIPLPAEPRFGMKAKTVRVDLKKEQAMAMVGVPGVKADSELRHVVELMLSALNGQSSRIFKLIREDNGLAYNTGLISRLGLHPGYLALYALVDPSRTDEALGMLESELKKIGEEGLTEEEFDHAKLTLMSERAFELQSARAIATTNVLNEYYGLGYESAFEELEIIQKMSFSEFNEAVKSLMINPCRVTVVVGDMSKMEDKNES